MPFEYDADASKLAENQLAPIVDLSLHRFHFTVVSVSPITASLKALLFLL